jgi:TetR/AcrR family transcriptional regulator, cholesterol catabolism regulator
VVESVQRAVDDDPRGLARLLSDVPSAARRAPRGVVRQQQIIEVSATMFHRQGYSETSMDDIADAVGLSKPSLYHYVKSKEDLLFHIVYQVHEDVQRILDEALSRKELSPLERLLRFATEQIESNTRRMSPIAVYHHEWRRLDGLRLEEVRLLRHRHELDVHGLIAAAKRAGEVPSDLDIELAAASIFAILIWPYTWYHEQGRVTPERLAAFVRQFIRNGLGAGSSS